MPTKSTSINRAPILNILLCRPDLGRAVPLPLPSPDLKNPGHTEDRPAVGGEVIEFRHDAFDFLR